MGDDSLVGRQISVIPVLPSLSRLPACIVQYQKWRQASGKERERESASLESQREHPICFQREIVVTSNHGHCLIIPFIVRTLRSAQPKHSVDMSASLS
jgi:hypothetical protein